MITLAVQKMICKPYWLPAVLIASCWFAHPASAQMQSESYRLNSSVLSGGGSPPTGSGNFILNGTVGQPSPLMDPDDPPQSPSHALKPGFWHTLDAMPATCDDAEAFASAFGSIAGAGSYNPACDQEGDGDVDGADLAVLVDGLAP